MRAQVYRLLKILGREALDREEKIFVCIDGIDHAARAKNVVSFLDSLYLPEEIPDGICVIIVILRLRLLKFGVKDSNVFQIILLHIVGVTRTVI